MVIATCWRLRLSVIATLAMGSVAREASAQPASAAQALFDEGRRLLRAGDVHAACVKLAESQRIEPAGGTLLNLAACHAREGKTATAWAEFNDALARAVRENRDDRAAEAKRQIAEIEPHLARLVVVVGASAPPGLEVSVDGTALGPASWGIGIPVDPGDHELRAAAPKHRPWSERVTVAKESNARVVIPELLATPPQAPDPAAPPAPPDGPKTSPGNPPVLAYVLLGTAVLGAGVGSYFGVVALKKKHDSEPLCTPAGCTSAGASLLREANTAAWGADASFAVSGAALVTAGVLFLTSRRTASTRRSLRLVPTVGASTVGIDVGGMW